MPLLTNIRSRLLLAFGLALALVACGGGGGGGGDPAPLVNAIPTGYYINTGTASVLAGTGNTQVTASDLEGMIYNNRLMMQSVTQGLSYDGTIGISGNSYSGTLSVYDDGVLLGTAPVSGTITQGSTVTGTLSGTGAGNGTFTLNYAATNGEVAGLSRVEDMTTPFWEVQSGGALQPIASRLIAPAACLTRERRSTERSMGATFTVRSRPLRLPISTLSPSCSIRPDASTPASLPTTTTPALQQPASEPPPTTRLS